MIWTIGMDTIENVDLSHNNLDDSEISNLVDFIIRKKSILHKLNLSHNHLTEKWTT